MVVVPMRRSFKGGGAMLATRPSAGFREQLAANQHTTDFAGARTNLIQLGVAPQAAQRVFVDVAVAPKNLDALSRHPGGLLGTPQNDGCTVLAHLAHMFGAEHVQVLANGVAKGPASLQ